MQKGREGKDNISESRSGFRGFGSRRTVMPNLFGGRDPFDDPFFNRPFSSMFDSSSTLRNMQKTSEEKGIVIEELNSDDEECINYSGTGDEDQKNSRSTKEPSVEHPDDDIDERKNKNVTCRNDHNKIEPQKHGNFSIQTSRVTYGGVDGEYYTSTRTRKIGADSVVLEESKEADKTTGQATHRISRGIQDKGHSFTRKLNSDGKVDTMQTLHNLNEDELSGFEEAWQSNNIGQLPGWKGGHDMHSNEKSHIWKNRSLPLLEQFGSGGGFGPGNETSTGGRTKKVVRINIE